MGNRHDADDHRRGRQGLCLRRRGNTPIRKSSAFMLRVRPIASRRWEPVRQGVHRCFGSIAPGVARGLMLRHDHGSNYISGDFQDEIECLGTEALPSFGARAPGQRRRGALHTNLEGEPIVGEDLRYDRRAASRARRVRQTLQRNLARRPPRSSYPSPGTSRSKPT